MSFTGIMKVLIPAAGFATRLYPLTHDKAKALLPIGGRPMIDYLIENINKLPDVDAIYVLSNDRFYPQFVEWSVQVKSKIPVVILNNHVQNNDDRLGAVGDMLYAVEKAKIDDHVLVIASDNMFTFDLRDLLRGFFLNGCSHIAAFDIQDKAKAAGRFGVLEVADDNRIVGFE